MAEKLTEDVLVDLFANNGIVQELNRTFFHPLGIEIKINSKEKKLEYYYTEEAKGFLLDTISDFQSKLFNNFRNEKHIKRAEALGFIIQVSDLYRTKNIKDSIPIPPSKRKFEKIISLFNSFAHGIYFAFISHHKENDENFDPSQFNPINLEQRILANLRQKEYEDVAALTCLLKYSKELQEYMKELQEYKPVYNKQQKQYERKVRKEK